MRKRTAISILGLAVITIGVLAARYVAADTESVRENASYHDWTGRYDAYKRDGKGRYYPVPRRTSFVIERDGGAFIHRINGMPRRERLREENNSLVPIMPDGGLRRMLRDQDSIIRVDYCYEVLYLVRGKHPDEWIMIDFEHEAF